MNLFQFTEMFAVLPKFEWSCSIYPNSIKVFGMHPNVSNCNQISMNLLYITQIWMKMF